MIRSKRPIEIVFAMEVRQPETRNPTCVRNLAHDDKSRASLNEEPHVRERNLAHDDNRQSGSPTVVIAAARIEKKPRTLAWVGNVMHSCTHF